MPIRRVPLATNYYYHVFNRSVGKVPVFKYQNDYQRALELLNYYRYNNTPLPFSKFKKLSEKERSEILSSLEDKAKFLVEIVAFCLMPNHFHLLLKQLTKEGIKTFLGNFQNSYAKYFNIKYQRTGALFQNSFKTILIEDDPQLLHLSRYIHLNPYSSLIIKEKKQLSFYRWSSLPQFLGKTSGFCQPNIVLDQFDSSGDYQEFVFNQADCQRHLEEIKHLIFE